MKTEYFWQILFVLLGALASAYAGYWFGNQPDQATNIEYRLDSNSNLQRLIGKTDKLKITYDSNDLDALSNITYLIANTSKKNLDKIKIYFEVDDKSKLPLFNNVSPPENYPDEAVTLISEKNGIYIYELEYLNRTDSIWDGISFSFYFSGGEPPKINVKTGTKGVSIRQHSFENVSAVQIFVKVISKTWWFLLIYIAGGYLYFKFARSHRKLKEELYKQNIALELADSSNKEQQEMVENIIGASKKEPSFKETLKAMFKTSDA